jgi:hypothetical protein
MINRKCIDLKGKINIKKKKKNLINFFLKLIFIFLINIFKLNFKKKKNNFFFIKEKNRIEFRINKKIIYFISKS